jgi:plasmid stabilization system protein ParE
VSVRYSPRAMRDLTGIADYPVFYTIGKKEIVILHVRHGARAPVNPDDL